MYTTNMNIPKISITDTTNTSGSVGMSAYVPGSVGLYDDFRIRKYVANESTVTTVSTGSEETPIRHNSNINGNN